MSSRFIYNNELPTSRGIFGNNTQPIWLQFVPGNVTHVFTSKETDGLFDADLVLMSPRSMSSISMSGFPRRRLVQTMAHKDVIGTTPVNWNFLLSFINLK